MNKVHILINSFSARLGGGQTYLINLLNNLRDQDEIKVTMLASLKSPWKFENKNIEIIYIKSPVSNPIIRFFWEIIFLPSLIKKIKPDILFFPGGVISPSNISSCKVVTMFRNMLPFDEIQIRKYPLFSITRYRLRVLRYLMLKSMEKADFVIFISHFAKDIILKQTSKGIKKYVVIPHGVSSNFNISENKIGSEESYILYPSTFYVYKSQLEVVEAYKGLLDLRKGDAPKLYLAGTGEEDYLQRVKDLIFKYNLNDKVKLLGHVPYTKMPQIYSLAKIVIFASQTENCPNILLESMASAKPIACSNMPPMPEFGGDAVAYFDPRDPQELTNVLNKLLNNQEEFRDIAQRAFERSKMYTWEKCSENTWNEFKRG